jgi:hypothetical protein
MNTDLDETPSSKLQASAFRIRRNFKIQARTTNGEKAFPKTRRCVARDGREVQEQAVEGQVVTFGGEEFYRISNYDRMRPFFMTVVSDADHWMFVSSNGALSAGRRNPDLALFPYYTDDKIRDMVEVTGSKTVLVVRRNGKASLWEPFSDRGHGAYQVKRTLFKNLVGNKLIFEETNQDLSLTFRYGWFNSNRFGFVRKAWVINTGTADVQVRLLDGLRNVMPCGTSSQFNLEYSTLLDAYKRSELITETGLGLFRLSAIPVDRPEPAEALRTNMVWSVGLRRPRVLLSSRQLDRFRQGLRVQTEGDVRGERGAYFVETVLRLGPGRSADWLIVADVGQGPSEVANINRLLRAPARLRKLVEADVERGALELERIVASADGLQKTAEGLTDSRHFNNTLFNVMRGGVFSDGYKLDPEDLRSFVANANKAVARRHAAFFRSLPRPANYQSVVAAARKRGDAQLERLYREYLPLTFSRRHGDPSRPWNRFSIAPTNGDGGRSLNYEGNWRDIFQNWEALAVSFPGYVSGMICRFLNASTSDGYNPYRITRNGIDWEIIDPHDPWSYIGYWGDHQIIYLLKLLEILNRHDPATLRDFLTSEIFAFANVPYRIKPYEQIIEDPKDTVIFERRSHEAILRRVKDVGSDGRLVEDKRGEAYLVNLTEKLLISILAKLTNFIPEAGLWLNTQRPEWNDANNALVGNGASMVTLYYLRRHLMVCREILVPLADVALNVSSEVSALLDEVRRALEKHRSLLRGSINDRDRRRVLDSLGRAGGRYRGNIYEKAFCGRKTPVTGRQLSGFFDLALEWIDQSTRANRNSDGLYHAYNLVRFEKRNGVSIRRLYEMLEGQVAVLSSGLLSPLESLEVLEALRRSSMYRADQHSYLLYPSRELPRFLEKNNIPSEEIKRSGLLQRMLADCNQQLVERDITGRVHFTPSITNGRDVRRILDQLEAGPYRKLARRDRRFVLALFERVFDHESFTGRSGTFYGYEGLGCIYWHMVSKLRLAAQESYFRAVEAGAPRQLLSRLAECYHDIREGIGDCKTPEEYGGFPMDPYSHTPAQGGARQPGLTGQVKEDFLCRMGELGVFVESGEIHFRPFLLRAEEFLATPAQFTYVDVAGTRKRIRLHAGSLGFTYCQVPVVYRIGRRNSVSISQEGGSKKASEGLRLDSNISGLILQRSGKVVRVEVALAFSKANGFCLDESKI